MSVPDDHLEAPAAATVESAAPMPRPSQFTVWLRQGFNEQDEALLMNVASKVTGKDGSSRLCLRCANVDTSHGFYLEADCFSPNGDAALIAIKIPHQLVVLIIGDDPQRPLGFAVD